MRGFEGVAAHKWLKWSHFKSREVKTASKQTLHRGTQPGRFGLSNQPLSHKEWVSELASKQMSAMEDKEKKKKK